MATLMQRFAALQREDPGHSSFVVFSQAIEGQPLSKSRVAFYFKKLVDKGDYAKSDSKALVKWLNTKVLTKSNLYDRRLIHTH